ncbi:MAG TPA: lysine 2,3-aminomutase [Thermoleophilia bacterium]|nr:lysine 2,3-aminomutase [Thermoleophilia bacterium]
MARHYSEIPRFKDVTDEQWNDWRWQVRQRLTTVEDFDQVLDLSDEQRADLQACMGRFRVAVTPYYASLMDPDDPGCPVRMQGVPSTRELIIGKADMKDAIAETIDSPTTLITHRYPDRVLFITTEMCSMYCRHCTRRRIVGEHEGAVSDQDYENAFTYIRRNPEVRDVLLSGGDPLTLSDNKLEWLLQRVTEIEHVEIVRLGSRMPVVCPQRITPELCAMLKKYHPLYLNTHFNHPKEITPESRCACEMLADAGMPLGNQTVLMRGVNDCARVMKRLVHGLVQIRVKPYYYYQCDLAEGTGHFRTSVAKGIEIYESLRGHTTGFAVPTYIIDAIGGGGKTPVIPTYMISQGDHQVVLRNYEGVISKYTEPEEYQFECHCGDCEAERARLGVARLFDEPGPTLEDVWAARWQKVADRKALMADIHTEPFRVAH